MKPIKKVLVPVDFSEASLHALAYGRFVALEFSARLVLLHVIHWPSPARFGQFIPAAEEQASRIEQVEEALAALVPDSDRQRIDCDVTVAVGQIEERILETVSASSIDLVVMGSHGRRPFAHWFLGSVTERILRKLPVPVMTVTWPGTAKVSPRAEVSRFGRILCPSDLTDAREVALPVAADLARRYGATLDIAHVVELLKRSPTSPTWTDEELAREQEKLEAHASRVIEGAAATVMGGEPIPFTPTVLAGRASEQILLHAKQTGADLIVMTLHKMNFIERALLGATAERVVRMTTIPVLCVPGEPPVEPSETSRP